jgi:hypothetical protein
MTQRRKEMLEGASKRTVFKVVRKKLHRDVITLLN